MLLLQRIYSTNIDCFVVEKTRQDVYYHNIVSTISWHTVNNKKKNASSGVPN